MFPTRPASVSGNRVLVVDELRPDALAEEGLVAADEATLDVVRLLARRAEASGFLLVLSYRNERLHRDHPVRLVLGELPPGGAVVRLELRGLSREAVGALAARSGLNAGELFERTAGNPFFVTETLAAGTALVPETIRDAVPTLLLDWPQMGWMSGRLSAATTCGPE